ncbi:MAG: M20/M25/M40 family metallo-hydrolase, partial [bacterium]|nr:M20/M25/M40 family metallo-hydrolase [bacterium]
ASHAGTTPLPSRQDALLGASHLVQAVQTAATMHAPHGRGTVGQLTVKPNSRNVVPERVDCTIDIRHPDPDALQDMAQHIQQMLSQICTELKLSSRLEEIWYAPPTDFHPACIDALRRAADCLNLAHMDIISGAGHDAKYLAQICPTAMVFIPCKDGISHNEIEAADKTHVAAGCHVLLQAILEQAEG